MSTDIAAAVQRLNGQLPLKDRQNRLPAPLAGLHREVLRCLFEHGRAPSREEIGLILDGGDLDQALRRLGGDDLVVLNEAGHEVVGAYPMTEEDMTWQLDFYAS